MYNAINSAQQSSPIIKIILPQQVNICLDDETLSRIDNCRITLVKELNEIPARPDVVRIAIDEYLNKSGKTLSAMYFR